MKSIVSLFVVLLTSTALLAAETGEYTCPLTALLMCDTSNPKTAACHQADLDRIQANLKGIADLCNMKLAVTILKNKEITLKNIKKWKHSISRHQSGTQFIYYTGDKQRSVKGHDKYPHIAIFDEKRHSTSLSTKQFYDMMVKLVKGGLYFFDCYNEIKHMEMDYFYFPDPIKASKANNKTGESQSNPMLAEGLGYLFRRSKFVFSVYSSTQNEPAYGIIQDDKKGGLLTLALCDSLSRAQTRPIFWQSIFADMSAKCLLSVWPGLPSVQHDPELMNQKIIYKFDEKRSVHPDCRYCID